MADASFGTQEKVQMPLIGDRAPEFRAMTTMGKISFPCDFKGSWVVLFSHPADFTPVCTTEFIALAKASDEFAKLNTRLLGLSIDSLHSHLAWVKSIEGIDLDGKGAVKVPFPVIADVSMNVAKKYGMLQSVAKTQTVRAVFVIDPEGVIRSILFYPMTTGRNIPEIINVSTPADWKPGDPVVMGAPLTLEEAEGRMNSGDENLRCVDWYLTMKKQ